MKAAVYKDLNVLEIVDMPVPELNKRNGAIVNVSGCGLCGSDIVKMQRGLASKGDVLGHEVVGIIENINTSVEIPFKNGDRVAIAHHVPCNNCRFCHQESYSMCQGFKTSNFEPGGFAQKIFVSESHLANTAVKVPEGVSNIEASLMEPFGCVLRALDRLNLVKGQNVLVVGLGFVGQLFVHALKMYDVTVLGCDVIDKRLAIGLKNGLNFAINAINTDDAIVKINQSVDFKGVDVVILVSGASVTVDFAVKALRDGGKILVFASVPDEITSFPNNEIYYRELTVLGAYSSSPIYLPRAMRLIESLKGRFDDLFEVARIENINDAIEKTVNHQFMKVFFEL